MGNVPSVPGFRVSVPGFPNVYSRGKVKEKLNYMHANPVIRKLVKHPKDWPWSSWSEHMKGDKGLIEIDVAL